ncbi:hypothetical protein OPKNFCMD_5567 [Methylobacterium crusticola]|uniref:Sarcosine oxidase subunit gamma n=1 Tax=Methylobacterium crusticola TaxID=1697972 RepID=A0ABQ4R525_9HYPH|nr:sarcosine oxidase subunit gamma family protein [Methylobacterium crusticola]GJD52800.1 hypothetical protein OPKNFCMD_5567 [Methylobacterium crusticola]
MPEAASMPGTSRPGTSRPGTPSPGAAAEASLRPVPAFGGLAASSPDGRLVVREREGLGLATVTARRGRGGDLAEVLRASRGLVLRPGPTVSRAGDLALVGTGPETWFAVGAGGGWRFSRALAATLAGLAAVADQSSGYGVLRLSGPAVRAVLAKGVPVDLHPSAFAAGDAAVTLAGHVGIVLWRAEDRADGEEAFDVAVFRSYAESFRHWLFASAAEFGLADGPAPGPGTAGAVSRPA